MADTAKFIVIFKDFATPEQIQQFEENVNETGGTVINRFDGPLKGFSAQLTPEQLSSFQGDSIIDYIEPDSEVHIQ